MEAKPPVLRPHHRTTARAASLGHDYESERWTLATARLGCLLGVLLVGDVFVIVAFILFIFVVLIFFVVLLIVFFVTNEVVIFIIVLRLNSFRLLAEIRKVAGNFRTVVAVLVLACASDDLDHDFTVGRIDRNATDFGDVGFLITALVLNSLVVWAFVLIPEHGFDCALGSFRTVRQSVKECVDETLGLLNDVEPIPNRRTVVFLFALEVCGLNLHEQSDTRLALIHGVGGNPDDLHALNLGGPAAFRQFRSIVAQPTGLAWRHTLTGYVPLHLRHLFPPQSQPCRLPRRQSLALPSPDSLGYFPFHRCGCYGDCACWVQPAQAQAAAVLLLTVPVAL